MSNQSLRTVVVNYSITNSKIENDDYRDNVAPFSFLDFINYTQADYSPEEYSSFYSSYLQNWYSLQDISAQEQKTQFKDYYQQFIKEIVISYTTESEKRFLENIDFNNSSDLDIAIPFFANRLKDIALFYKKKRDEGKYVIDRNKLKGSTTGVEKAIFDNIYNFIFTAEDSKEVQTATIAASVSGLGIEIEEFVDVYGDYFDLPSDGEANNINNIDTKYYLDPLAIEAITGQENFIGAIRTFKINPPAVTPEEFDAICNPDNELVQATNAYKTGGLSLAEVYSLKRSLIKKYLGTDIYYIDTTTTPPTSGLLIAADNPTSNALNLQGADAAQVESNDVRLLRDIGLNFKPDNIGLFKLQAETYTYSINLSALSNEFVIFPDPNRYGNVSVNPVSSYPVYYKFDYRDNVRNVSSGIASGDPKITNKVTTFEPYTTKERNSTQLKELNDISYKLNFTDLFDQGVIDKYQTDIFGNEYALLKYTPLQPRITDQDYIKNLLLDGHTFWDINEGYNFNYSTASVNGDTIRSGLTANTNGYQGLNTFLTLYFREFSPYQNLIKKTRNLKPFWRDGGAFTFFDGSELPNPISGIGPDFPSPLNYYYTVLAEGTFPEEVVLTTDQTPLSDITTEADFLLATGDVEIDFSQDIRYYLSAGDPYTNYDGGFFTDEVNLPNDFIYSDNYRYLDNPDPRGATVLSTLSSQDLTLTTEERKALDGRLYVKNGSYSDSQPLSTALSNILQKYSTSIQTDINLSLLDFDIIQNTIFLETKSNLLIDKIEYKDSKFNKPSTVNTLYSVNSSVGAETFSNRFYVESTGKVYFARFQTIGVNSCEASPKNNLTVYPEIYEYSILDNKVNRVYPADTASTTLSVFNVNTAALSLGLSALRNYTIEEVHTPKIAYNKKNDIFKLTYIVNDLNDMSHFIDVSFKQVDNDLTLQSIYKYEDDDDILRSTTFGLSSMFGSISANSGAFTRNTNNFTVTI